MSHVLSNSAEKSAQSNEALVSPDDQTGASKGTVVAESGGHSGCKPEVGRETADLWRDCVSYRKDSMLAQGRGLIKAPRIPDTILDRIRRLGVDLNRAVSALGVTPEHLRNALSTREKPRFSQLAKVEDPLVLSLSEVTEEVVSHNAATLDEASMDLRGVRGEDAKLRVHLAVLAYFEKNGEFPSKSYLRKSYRIATATADKYWPTFEELGVACQVPSLKAVAVPDISRTSPVDAVTPDLVMAIAALESAVTLVDGTYSDGGITRCDVIEHDERGPRLMVHAWRKEEAVIAEIIRLASKLQFAS